MSASPKNAKTLSSVGIDLEMKTILQRNIKDLCIERQATAEQGAQLVSYCCFLDYLSHGPPSISKIIFFKYESFSSCPPSPTALFSSVS